VTLVHLHRVFEDALMGELQGGVVTAAQLKQLQQAIDAAQAQGYPTLPTEEADEEDEPPLGAADGSTVGAGSGRGPSPSPAMAAAAAAAAAAPPAERVARPLAATMAAADTAAAAAAPARPATTAETAPAPPASLFHTSAYMSLLADGAPPRVVGVYCERDLSAAMAKVVAGLGNVDDWQARISALAQLQVRCSPWPLRAWTRLFPDVTWCFPLLFGCAPHPPRALTHIYAHLYLQGLAVGGADEGHMATEFDGAFVALLKSCHELVAAQVRARALLRGRGGSLAPCRRLTQP